MQPTQHDLTTRSTPQGPAPGVAGLVPGPFPPAYPLSMAVGRAMGTVVVTLRGALDRSGSTLVDDILVDLIDNQGNLTLIVDVRALDCDDGACLEPFRRATLSATRMGGTLTVADPSDALRVLLESSGLGAAVRTTRSRAPHGAVAHDRAGDGGVPTLGAASPRQRPRDA